MLKTRSGGSASAKLRRAEVGRSIVGKQVTLRDYCKIYTYRTWSVRASLQVVLLVELRYPKECSGHLLLELRRVGLRVSGETGCLAGRAEFRRNWPNMFSFLWAASEYVRAQYSYLSICLNGNKELLFV